MTQIIDGKEIAAVLRGEVAKVVEGLAKAGKRVPGLAVIQVGAVPASSIYVRNKEKACTGAGMLSFRFSLPEECTQAELLELVNQCNKDPKIDGILCQLPLPAHIDAQAVIAAIDPEKDVDGFHPVNVGRLSIGLDCLKPCTPSGVIEMLRYYNFDLAGKNAVVLGRSNIVGKPAALLLLKEHCTVTIAHSKTKNLKEICAKADILVSAMGRLHMVDRSYTNPDQIIIDVSINRTDDGKVCGDVDYDAVAPYVKAITPVPGGVGPMTIAMLLKNTLQAYARTEGITLE